LTPLVTVADVARYEGQTIRLQGWLYSRTEKGKLAFLRLRDGTGLIQAVVLEDNVEAESWEMVGAATQESSVEAVGSVRRDRRAPGGFELEVKQFTVISLAEDGYPVQPKEHGTGFLMQQRHLWIRSPRQATILRIRATIIRAIRDWLDDHGFVNVDTPILTPAACEGTTTLFETDYFGEPAYLTQSGQLYNEASIAALGKVYCFGPTFRAEKSKTRRHLTEFWMVEPEIAFASLEDVIEVAEAFVCHIVERTLEQHEAQMTELLGRDLAPLQRVKPPFPRLSYDEAVQLLHQRGLDFNWGDDFGAPHETAVSEAFDQPVFVYHYPAAVKAFYMEEVPGRPDLSRSVDLIAPEGYGEIIGGGQRAASRDLIERRIAEHELPREAYDWYVDLRRYGSVPHAGFGLGVERTVAWLCGLPHLREAIAFPRMLEKLYP
jgi:asparaginyl-tRNA synthetase